MGTLRCLGQSNRFHRENLCPKNGLLDFEGNATGSFAFKNYGTLKVWKLLSVGGDLNLSLYRIAKQSYLYLSWRLYAGCH